MRWQPATCVLLATLCSLLAVRFVATQGESLATAPDIAWAAPTELALNNLGPADRRQLDVSTDCTPLGYRMNGDNTMREGCFIETAFGRIDPAKSLVIMNGTDEAEYVKEGSRLPALMPLPHSGSVSVFGGFPTVGSYLYLYSNFYSALASRGSPLFGGRYKEITRSPDMIVRDPAGQPLLVNPLTFAYAPRSQWFVTEVPNKSLVRVSMADFSVLPFAPALNTPGRPSSTGAAAMAVTGNGRYAAIASGEFKTLRVYDLKNCGASGDVGRLDPQQCRSYDYWPYIEEQVAGTVDSIGHLYFSDSGLLSMNVRTTAGSYETYLLSPSGPITALIPFLGLGDSYASGQGAFNYLSGSDTEINKCHLSTHSYPLLLSRSLFSNRGRSVACSGARSHDVGSVSADYSGQSSEQKSARSREADGSEVAILHNFTPGYLAQQRFVTSYQPGVMTLEIGGNDIGFSTLLLRCLSPISFGRPPSLNANNCYQSREDRLELVGSVKHTYPKLVALYKQLGKQSPASRLYVIGYPQIVSANAQCRVNVQLTLSDIAFAREVTSYINATIQQAASAAGVRYVDVSDAFAGRELCSGSAGTLAVNGLTAGDDKFGLGQESFHPNAHGHELLKQVILRKTSNLTLGSRTAPVTPTAPPNDSSVVGNASSTGRTVRSVSQQPIVNGSVNAGQPINIRVDGQAAGFLPSNNYTVTIAGTNSGTIRSDSNGNVTGTVPIPPGSAGGPSTVVAEGPGQGGPPTAVEETVFVPPVNPVNNCPFAAAICQENENASSTPSTPSTPNGNQTRPETISTANASMLVQPAGHGTTTSLSQRLKVVRAVGKKPVLTISTQKAVSVLGTQTRKQSAAGARVPVVALTSLGIFYWYVWAAIMVLVLLIIGATRKKNV